MVVKELKSEKLYREYSLQIPYEEVDDKINKKIQDLIPEVTIPGFRKGKAPIAIVKKKYETDVLNEVLQNIVNTKTTDLIKEKDFKLFRQPKIDLKTFEKNKPISVELKIDLQPNIKLKDFSKINLNNYEIDLTKKVIEEQFKKFLSSQKSYIKIKDNRFIKKTDKIIINLETKDKNIPEYLKLQKNLPVEMDNEQEILPGLSDKLLSKKPKVNDKLNLFFDLSNVLKDENLNKIDFEIEILSIEEKVKFELTKDFLEKNGFKDENQLREFLKKNMIDQYNHSLRNIEKKQLMDNLDQTYNFDLPQGVLDDDFHEIWHRIENAKKVGNLDSDDKSLNDDQLKKRYKKISERRVKLGVLLQFIAKEEKISVSEDDLSKGIMQYASQYPGQEKQILDYLKKNPSHVESIKGPLLEDKVIDLVKSKIKIKKMKINEDQFKKLEQEVFDIKKDKKNERSS